MAALWSYANTWLNTNSSDTNKQGDDDLDIQSISDSRVISTIIDDIFNHLLESPVLYLSKHNPVLNLRLQRHRSIWMDLLSKTNVEPDCKLCSLRQTAGGQTVIVPEETIFTNCMSFELLIHRDMFRDFLLCTASNPDSKWRYHNLRIISCCLFMNVFILPFLFQNGRCDIWRGLIAAWIASLLNQPASEHFNGLDPLRHGLLHSMKYWDVEHWKFAFECGFQQLIDIFTETVETPQPDPDALIQIAGEIPSRLYALNFRGGPGRSKKLSGKDFWPLLRDMIGYFKIFLLGVGELRGPPSLCKYPSVKSEDKRQIVKKSLRRQSERDKQYKNACGWPPCFAKLLEDENRRSRRTWKCGCCRLIRYCCKNHQKKHWKFIHRQQCRDFDIEWTTKLTDE